MIGEEKMKSRRLRVFMTVVFTVFMFVSVFRPNTADAAVINRSYNSVSASFTGFAKNGDSWCYYVNGSIDKNKTDVIQGTVNGHSGWWFVKGGKVQFTDSVEMNKNGWWVIRSGMVDFNFTGLAQNANGWWYCRNGKVDFNYTGLAQNTNGWWYCRNGKVDFNYTGFAKNSNGWWYCEKGKVRFNKTDVMEGKVNGQSGWWFVKGSKVQFINSVEMNKNGWWVIRSGMVDFSFTGIASNSNGSWYCKNGKVQFGYSGNIKYKGKTYIISNGRVKKTINGEIDAFYGDTFSLSIGKDKTIERPGIMISLISKNDAGDWIDGIVTIDGTDHYFALEQNNGKYEVVNLDYNDKVDISFVKKSGSSYYLKVTAKKAVKKAFKVSGKATDHYVTKDFEYLESDNLIIFMPKGIHFDGNVMKVLEKYVAEVEKATGLKRKVITSGYYNRQAVQKDFFGTNVFCDIDPELKKIHVFIDAADEYSPECCVNYNGSEYNHILIHEYDLDVNNKDYFFSTFMHEYTHYVQLTNYAYASNIIGEGYASYIEEKVANKYMKLNDSSLYQERFYGYLILKGSVTAKNAEQLFIKDYATQRTDSYRYGCYFTKYLIDTYGDKAYKSFLKKVTTELEKKKKIDESVEILPGSELAKLVKSSFSQDVFKDFANWLAKHPEYTKENDD